MSIVDSEVHHESQQTPQGSLLFSPHNHRCTYFFGIYLQELLYLRVKLDLRLIKLYSNKNQQMQANSPKHLNQVSTNPQEKGRQSDGKDEASKELSGQLVRKQIDVLIETHQYKEARDLAKENPFLKHSTQTNIFQSELLDLLYSPSSQKPRHSQGFSVKQKQILQQVVSLKQRKCLNNSLTNIVSDWLNDIIKGSPLQQNVDNTILGHKIQEPLMTIYKLLNSTESQRKKEMEKYCGQQLEELLGQRRKIELIERENQTLMKKERQSHEKVSQLQIKLDDSKKKNITLQKTLNENHDIFQEQKNKLTENFNKQTSKLQVMLQNHIDKGVVYEQIGATIKDLKILIVKLNKQNHTLTYERSDFMNTIGTLDLLINKQVIEEEKDVNEEGERKENQGKQVDNENKRLENQNVELKKELDIKTSELANEREKCESQQLVMEDLKDLHSREKGQLQTEKQELLKTVLQLQKTISQLKQQQKASSLLTETSSILLPQKESPPPVPVEQNKQYTQQYQAQEIQKVVQSQECSHLQDQIASLQSELQELTSKHSQTQMFVEFHKNKKIQAELKLATVNKKLKSIMNSEKFKTLQNHQKVDHLFQGQILDEYPDYKFYLRQTLENKYKSKLFKTKLLYQFDQLNPTNFHKYIDNKECLLVIIKVDSQNIIAGYYHGKLAPKIIPDKDALLMSLNNREIFQLAEAEKKGVTYDESYFVMGNSELRVKWGEKKLFSNFGINNSYFRARGHKVNVLTGNVEKDCDFEQIQFYQAIYF